MKKNKIALITGITGQDGSYLASFLLDKGYEVHGIKRRASSYNTERIDDLILNEEIFNKNLFLHYGDMTDGLSLQKIIRDVKPDEIYNLAAQSHVMVSFEAPEYTVEVDGVGVLRLLEILRSNNELKETKLYQASTSELYGKVLEIPQNEETPFNPQSPYAIAKLYSYWLCKNYRDAYGLFIVNGILFNHESPRRGETFITQKIAYGVANYFFNKNYKLTLGNLNAERDWGHAKEYVDGMWRTLQLDKPDDYVLATGRKASVRSFVELCFKCIDVDVEWSGDGINEKGIDKKTNKEIISVDKRYFRPTEVDLLIGDSSKAKKTLNWEAKISLEELANEMVENAIEKFGSKNGS